MKLAAGRKGSRYERAAGARSASRGHDQEAKNLGAARRGIELDVDRIMSVGSVVFEVVCVARTVDAVRIRD